MTKDGVARVRQIFDARGNGIEDDYFGIDGKPTFRKGIASTYKYTFDSRGNVTSISFYGLKGEPVAAKGTIWKMESAFDGVGNDTEDSYFGVDGKPILGGAVGYARVRRRFDVYGNVIEEDYFGVDDKPIDSKDGYARIVRAYDLRGRVVEKSFADAEGRPILIDDIGVKAIYTYDDDNNVIDVAYLDAQGHEIPTEVKVTKIAPDTTAARIGLAPGDRLLSYDGVKLRSTEQLIAMISAGQAGDHVLVVRRGSEVASIRIPAGRIGVTLETVRAKVGDQR